jgi:hypothetical protein
MSTPGHIYKISSYDNKLHYYGLTQQSVEIRFNGHKQSYINYCNDNQSENYCHSFIIFHKYDIEDIIIYTIESYDNISYQELLKRELFYIENFECVNFSRKTSNFNNYTDIYNNIITNITTQNDIFIEKNDKYIQSLLTILGYTYNTNNHFIYTKKNIISYYIKKKIQPVLDTYFTDFNIKQYNLYYDINYILNKYNLQLLKKPVYIHKLFMYRFIVQPLIPII